jgi:hypothetical protein
MSSPSIDAAAKALSEVVNGITKDVNLGASKDVAWTLIGRLAVPGGAGVDLADVERDVAALTAALVQAETAARTNEDSDKPTWRDVIGKENMPSELSSREIAQRRGRLGRCFVDYCASRG